MSNRLTHLTFFVIAGFCAGAAWAGVPGDPRPLVTGQAFAPLAAGATVAVEPRDDSDANLHLRDLMAARLTAHHHPAAAGAALRLRFSAEASSDVGPRPGAASGDLRIASDRQSYTPSNLGYSEADRIFSAPIERDRGRGAIENRYVVRASLETRDGHVLWRGQAIGALSDRNEARLAAALAEALADRVGETFDSSAPAATATAAPSLPPPAPAPTALGGPRLPLLSLPELAERR
jgi:hypothetical protein